MSRSRDGFLEDNHVVFASIGTVALVQDLLGEASRHVHGMDPANAAEDTLCLAAQLTLCAAVEGGADIACLKRVVRNIPAMYLDYALGNAAARQKNAALLDERPAILSRISRCQAFYAEQLPDCRPIGTRQLREKLEIWMGRISPPGLPDKPIDRIERMTIQEVARTHMLLIKAYWSQAAGPR